MEGGIKTGVFGQYLVRFISKTVKDTATVATKSKQETQYCTQTFEWYNFQLTLSGS